VSQPIVPRDPQALAFVHLNSRGVPHYLTREQVTGELLPACQSERDRMFVRVAFETGGRVSELVGICRSDIDLSNRQIRLVTLKRRRDLRRRRAEVFRWIPVSHALCADLAVQLLAQARPVEKIWTRDEVASRQQKAIAYLTRLHSTEHAAKIAAMSVEQYSAHRGLPLTPPARSDDSTARLFPFSRQRAFDIIRDAGKRAGLVARGGREISPHILRHSFAMNCLTQGVPITVLKDLLGHASITSTMVYLVTDPALAREFVSKVRF
jgi:site-specific recombinase XerD